MKEIIIYTDGACRNNPGPGGYGAILSYTDSRGLTHEQELSGGYGLTTNNRMELMAAIVALEALKEPCKVQLYSDSSYLVNAHLNRWIDGWKKADWKHKGPHGKEDVKNKDLWQRLLNAEKEHIVSYFWVKGHALNDKNNRCDELATSAADHPENHIAKEFLEV